MTSNVGKWDRYYSTQPKDRPFGYSQSPVFHMGAEWLGDCDTVADWGCGGGMLRNYITPADRYFGIDGSQTPQADCHADLVQYRGRSSGVFMRNVLEHNFEWETILANALESFTVRMVLVIFTPWHDGPEDVHQLRWETGYGVPTLAFRRDAIVERLDGAGVEWMQDEISAGSYYGLDHLFRIAR